MTTQAWGRIHHSQLCRVTGWIEHGGRRVAFSGNGIRDHTVGPRDFTSLARHCWISGLSPHGRGFLLLSMESSHSVAPLNLGFVLEDGQLHDAEPIAIPYMRKLAERDSCEPLVLRYSGGEARISVELLHSLSLGLMRPNELTIGCDPDAATNLVVEGHSRFEWDGEELYGLTERSLAIDANLVGRQGRM